MALSELLNYEQPGKYRVKSTAYSNNYNTPVLTAGQSFILGHTDELEGIYYASPENPTIIFDDFTTSFKWVDFPFKVKSSAMKLLTPKDEALGRLKFLFYYMQTLSYTPQNHARQWIGTYSKFCIPIPAPEEQTRIITILDKFDSLVNDLSIGLLAEIKARRQQYEYYLDKLLTFKEAT